MCNKHKITNYDGKEYRRKLGSIKHQLVENTDSFGFYTVKDEDGKVALTICVAKGHDDAFVRGIAVCSPHDNHCKAVGEFYAGKRVLQALAHKVTGGTIRRDEAWDVLRDLMTGIRPSHKVFYNVEISPEEAELLVSKGFRNMLKNGCSGNGCTCNKHKGGE